MSVSGFPGEDVDIHLKIHGHLPEMECYEVGDPPIKCVNPNYNGVQRISKGQEAGKISKSRVEITAPSPYAGQRAWKNYRRELQSSKKENK